MTSATPGNLPLLFSVFVIALCGIVYELLAGTISSYLTGDSVYQFSIAVGVFMSSMGLGSFLSRFIRDRLADWFVFVQVLIGIVGGLSSPILFFAFSKLENYPPVLFLVSITIGTLIGLELPLIFRIMRQFSTMRLMVSNVMTADYIGALLASVLFPLVFVPRLGLIRTSLFFGLLNLAVAFLGIWIFREVIGTTRRLVFLAASATLLLVVCFVISDRLTSFVEDGLYKDEIIYSATTAYQRVVATRFRDDVKLFINGSIQFSTKDEYRYHESLVHPAMMAAAHREHVLILGGGDGFAAREALRYPEVSTITIVDIDPGITDFFRTNVLMRKFNQDAMNDPRVRVVNDDAWKYVEAASQTWDIVIVDLPDPDSLPLSRLYSNSFFRLLSQRMSGGGILTLQATSPLYAREAFWCIKRTLESVNSPALASAALSVQPYHAFVPSFGEWGFILASPRPIAWGRFPAAPGLRFITPDQLEHLKAFPKDMQDPGTGDINRLENHVLPRLYEKGWQEWSF